MDDLVLQEPTGPANDLAGSSHDATPPGGPGSRSRSQTKAMEGRMEDMP